MAEDPSGDNPDRPAWLPENFKSEEAFAQAYAESQRKITEQGQQLSAANETINTFASQFEELTARTNNPPADQGQVDNQWAEMYENDPFGTMVLLNRQLAQENAETLRQEIAGLSKTQLETRQETIGVQAKLAMKDRFSDWDELQAGVVDELGKNPLFSDESPVWRTLGGTTAALEQAYLNVKSRESDDDPSGLKSSRDMKLAAQGLTGAGGKPAPANDEAEAWDRIRNAGHHTYAELTAKAS